MIHELAYYEKEPFSSVLATEESLRRTLTFASFPTSTIHPNANPGYAKTLIIRLPAQPSNPSDAPGAVAGMAMFFNNYSTWRSAPGVYLEDLFVRPAYRKRGYATLMIRELAREVKRIGGGRLEWKCLEWNEPSLKFYRGLGAVEQKEWVGLRVDGEALERLAAE
jgi:GNAT superfamily N-acetyltransferase